MSVQYTKKSLKDLHERKKSLEELTAENKELRERVQATEAQLTDTQLALCDVYEALMGGEG